MFKIEKRVLLSPSFKGSMSKLANCAGFKMKVGYNIMRTAKALEKELVKSQNELNEIKKKYAEMDDSGNFKLNEAKDDLLWKEGKEEEAKKAIEEFGISEVLIDRQKFTLEDLSPAGLTPGDLANLDPLLQALEVI
jgi:hypothetical protein